MKRRWKAALGFGGGMAVGILLGVLLTMGMTSLSGVQGPDSRIGVMNLLGMGVGAFVGGAIGGASLGRGLRPMVGYGIAFVPMVALSAFSLLMFL
jgi:hypothetical protein